MQSKILSAVSIGALFTLLAVSAGSDFPEAWFGSPMPRGLRALAWAADLLAGPLGAGGAAIAFGSLGLAGIGLVARRGSGSRPHGAAASTRAEPEIVPERRRSFGTKAAAGGPMSAPVASDDWFDLDEILFGGGHNQTPRPGWALLLRSPFTDWTGASSWLGGVPHAPADFRWPRDPDGTPQLFLAQIDLAAIAPEPRTGLRPEGLPESGALLIFAGSAASCHLITAAAMASAGPVTPPDELPAIRTYGFWGEGTAFPYWPVDPRAFWDEGKERPAAFPELFARPEQWITNWGIAAVEAEEVIRVLGNELREAERFLAWRGALPADDRALANAVIVAKSAHYPVIVELGSVMMADLIEWRDHALSQPPEVPVEADLLAALFRRRRAMEGRLVENYGTKRSLMGDPTALWRTLEGPAARLRAAPAALHGFIAAQVTDWRGHRLYGVEPEFPNNGEDLRGHDCLLSVHADRLIETDSEHEYGLSVWLPTEELRAMRLDHTRLVRHCAV
ncbi:protein of unknown function [Sphingomonas guangdongensis]|uniref:DUF1963 domain-containing protein n=1 Tax=Sphingomonas guangdongensis TaxID=1141890 RepID=A0A285QI37_9SPHN|nr:DUF1963 domain-containing protein [Sphingomonas guangdongensis]SOB81178.1 protein of unknown function [Sphingomonas guangdongensis]